MTFTGKDLFIPYLEDNRLRSFLLQNERLFELVWKGEEFKSDIVMIRHLEWIEKIHSVCRIDNYGLLLKCRTENRFVYKIYKPQPFNSNHSKNGGIFIELPTAVNQNDLHYSPKSKCLISLDENSLNISIFKTLEEINHLPCHKVEEIFNHEEYLEKLKFDSSFKSYQPRLITDACEIITNIPNNPRITQAYQIKGGCFNQIEIVAGINCKNIESLKDIIADDYVELKPEDFADYLGAPIIYPYYGRVGYTAFLIDMQNLKRSSKSFEVVTAYNGIFQTLFQMYLDQTTDERIFVGILSCKPKSDDMNDEDSIQEEKEYEIMFKRNEFKVEGKKLVVADVFSDIYPRRNYLGVIINNVRSGIWKWTTTNKSQDHANSEENDDNSIAQLAVIHQDYFNDLSNSKLWMVPDNVYRTPSSNLQMDEYYDDEIEGGWYVMKHGVTVYTETIGIFDLKHFNDEKCLGKIKKKTPLEKSITSVPEYSEWQDYLSEKMKVENSSTAFAVPYGIITNCYEEKGVCLFKKSKGGDVIAVRVIYF